MSDETHGSVSESSSHSTRTPSTRRSGAWPKIADDPAPAQTQPPGRIPAVQVPADVLAQVGEGAYYDPHSVLGAHLNEDGITVRVLRPFAQGVTLVTLGENGERVETPMEHEAHGVWLVTLPGDVTPDYRLLVRYPGGPQIEQDDPYRFMPTLGEVDLHLIGEGRHEQLWSVLGAHVKRYQGPMGEVHGTSFSVWAPNAQAVRLISDENSWDGRRHQLRSLGSAGVWELFVPGIGPGTRYKFQLLGRDGGWRERADPMARATEVPPATASVVTESTYTWSDQEWMAKRAETKVHASPMSVYEVHLGSWRDGLGYRELAEELVDYVVETGFTHVEFMPVAEHPFGGSWGYQVTSYFAPTSRFGSPDEFRYLVDRLHQAGIGAIVDWVPAHFPKDEWALAQFDGQALYEHADPRRGEQPDWGTLIFDFGRREVRNFLVANAIYWLEEFHLDGLRVDAVASMLYLDYSREDGQWTPNQYGGRENIEAIGLLQEVNATAYKRLPGIITIAEESTAWPGVTRPTHLGGLGFGLKWNMGWMHDSLNYVSKDPVHRRYHHHEMTFSMVYAFSENYCLPISHDEVVHGKGTLLGRMPGDRWQQLANLRAFLAFMWGHPGKKLLFMGQEFGQEAEWNADRSLDWWLLDQPLHANTQKMTGTLNRVYRENPPLFEIDSEPAGFEWIDGNDSSRNLFSFIRKDKTGNKVVVVSNFAGQPYEDFRLALPHGGDWVEIFNSDAEEFGGSGVVNTGTLSAEDVPWTGRDQSVLLRVPPLATMYLRPA